MKPTEDPHYQWFFETIVRSLEQYEWKVGEDGFYVCRRSDGEELPVGLMFREYGITHDFSVLGMATNRALGPENIQTKFSSQIREAIFDIVQRKR